MTDKDINIIIPLLQHKRTVLNKHTNKQANTQAKINEETCNFRMHPHMPCTTLHVCYRTFYYITLHCIYCNPLHYIALPYIALHYIILHYIALHYIVCITLQSATIRYSTVRCAALTLLYFNLIDMYTHMYMYTYIYHNLTLLCISSSVRYCRLHVLTNAQT